MANGIIVLILLVICVAAVQGYRKKLSHGCCGGGGDLMGTVTVRDKDPSHYPYLSELKIEGMTCKNCKMRVENTFNAEEGVWAQVDLRQGLALVRSKRQMEERELCKLVSRAGYRVTAVDGALPRIVY